MALELKGFHHLTAVSARIQENYRFYTQTMGMRLIKRSVNQDDVRAYHLFYSDAVGTPGHDLTFFDWNVPSEQRGTHSVVRTGLRVNGQQTLEYWKERFSELGVAASEITERDGRLVLDFEDPEGQRLSLIDDGGTGDPVVPWDRSPVPAEHQLRGLGPITMSVPSLRSTDIILTRVMNMQHVRQYALPESPKHEVHVYQMDGVGPHAELHVAVQPDLPFTQPGAGGVHHVAFRTPNDDQYAQWIERLNQFGVRNSGAIDRHYFRALYFREPNGILFEISTDGPGFAVDEDPATIGEKLILPPFLENRRAEIEKNLKPIE
ncbi:ring-cleaving dioxygenase [Deinococcus cellulosilyticus]|uniref:Glyoxalase n=1 Tax=Deinococcus cellulosilyticus (strain DSM 18568 / NBRC 106333 / KACC 11606 / 5516J-15) TaxID=1223518 RepID=A0A511MVR2_DEIC1|nr:ring-cleaving dioxygenase [Deinococcus cellulosilyticus]GEM44650.1 glyoxalase [Deinococcus cellulosilyticus NBRC 106333 = KACC 11606]